MISPLEARILWLFLNKDAGTFASDLLSFQDNSIKRGSIYTTLNRMMEKGLVEQKTGVLDGCARVGYWITDAGIDARTEFGKFTSFIA